MEHINATLKQSIKNTFSEMLIQKPCKSHVFKTRWWFLFSEICGVHVDSEDKKKKKRKKQKTQLYLTVSAMWHILNRESELSGRPKLFGSFPLFSMWNLILTYHHFLICSILIIAQLRTITQDTTVILNYSPTKI